MNGPLTCPECGAIDYNNGRVHLTECFACLEPYVFEVALPAGSSLPPGTALPPLSDAYGDA